MNTIVKKAVECILKNNGSKERFYFDNKEDQNIELETIFENIDNVSELRVSFKVIFEDNYFQGIEIMENLTLAIDSEESHLNLSDFDLEFIKRSIEKRFNIG